MLISVLVQAGLAYEKAEGEAAFYGPKIDVQVADPAGRETSLSTVQVDFYQPERLGLHYMGSDGGRHRPVMVHRSVIGSAECAVAHLIEVHGGAFPSRWRSSPCPMAKPAPPCAWRIAARSRAARARQGPGPGKPCRADPRKPDRAVPGSDRSREAAEDQVAFRQRDGRRFDARPAGPVLRRIADLIRVRGAGLWDESC